MNALTNLNMTTADTAGDNSEGRMDKLLGSMRELGKVEAAGGVARPTAGLKVCEAASEGEIDADDAERLYTAYEQASIRMAGKNPLAVSANKDSRKAQVSKMRSFIKMGALPGVDGYGTLHRAAAIGAEMRANEEKTQAPYVALLAVIAEQLRRPTEALDDDTLRGIIGKDEPAEKDLLAKLSAAYKTMHKLDQEADCAGTEAALRGIADAISELGGELPAVTKAEKAKEALVAKAAKFGASITF